MSRKWLQHLDTPASGFCVASAVSIDGQERLIGVGLGSKRSVSDEHASVARDLRRLDLDEIQPWQVNSLNPSSETGVLVKPESVMPVLSKLMQTVGTAMLQPHREGLVVSGAVNLHVDSPGRLYGDSADPWRPGRQTIDLSVHNLRTLEDLEFKFSLIPIERVAETERAENAAIRVRVQHAYTNEGEREVLNQRLVYKDGRAWLAQSLKRGKHDEILLHEHPLPYEPISLMANTVMAMASVA